MELLSHERRPRTTLSIPRLYVSASLGFLADLVCSLKNSSYSQWYDAIQVHGLICEDDLRSLPHMHHGISFQVYFSATGL